MPDPGAAALANPSPELAAFRIAQEALTNVVKHGGTAATATVELRYDADALHSDARRATNPKVDAPDNLLTSQNPARSVGGL